jgi:hypothetical protein
MDLPMGKIRIRLSGSAGGQNGMKSAIAHLGTQNFPRLRIGIGSPKSLPGDRDGASHVLGTFSAAEAKLIPDVLDLTVGAIELSLKQGVEKSMSLYNNRSVEQPTVWIIVSKLLPETTAHVRITRQSWQQGSIEGEVRANQFEWSFYWHFRQGELCVEPSLGRALIKEPLGRFLEQKDYQLEPGGDYSFTIRAEL